MDPIDSVDNVDIYIHEHNCEHNIGQYAHVFKFGEEFVIDVHLRHMYSFRRGGRYVYLVTNEIIRDSITKRTKKKREKCTLRMEMNEAMNCSGLRRVQDYLNEYTNDTGHGKVHIHYVIKRTTNGKRRLVTHVELTESYKKKYKRKRKKRMGGSYHQINF